jgi:hypothetical protein
MVMEREKVKGLEMQKHPLGETDLARPKNLKVQGRA